MAVGRAKPDPILQRRPRRRARTHPPGAKSWKPVCQRGRPGMAGSAGSTRPCWPWRRNGIPPSAGSSQQRPGQNPARRTPTRHGLPTQPARRHLLRGHQPCDAPPARCRPAGPRCRPRRPGPSAPQARSIVQLAVATTYTQQREIDQACAIASQALDLPADQRIGPITQRAQDLLRELEPWRGRPAVEELRERVVAS
jgi:hypothetical protein